MVCESEEKPSILKLVPQICLHAEWGRKVAKDHVQKKASSIQTRTFLAELGLAASSGVTVGSELRMPSYPPPLVHVSPSCPFSLSKPLIRTVFYWWVSAMAADRNITNLFNLRMTCVSATRSGENFPPGCTTVQTRFGNVYYHCNIPCIQGVSAPTSHLTCWRWRLSWPCNCSL